MSDTSESGRTNAEIEIRLSREDMLVLSDGRGFDKRETVEMDDGTVLNLTVTLTGEAAE